MNPPYQRNHHCDAETLKSIKRLKYTTGSTDLYIAFYEMALKMLNSTGKLGCIAPNSFMTNTSQKQFRNDMIQQQIISHIFNYKSYQVFANASTYTCICIMNKQGVNNLIYRECNKSMGSPLKISYTYLNKYVIDKTWTFGTMMDYVYLSGRKSLKDICTIQYGVSTNADHVYIGKAFTKTNDLYSGKHTDENTIVTFNGYPVESAVLRRCFKASNGDDNKYILFPYEYDNGCKVIQEDVFKHKYPNAYAYLLMHKNELLNRAMDSNVWYAFARTQGLSNMNHKKLVFKHIMKRDDQIVTAFALEQDVIVYSGMYITGTDDNLKKYKQYIETELFKEYCCFVGKPMANNYISVNGKAVQSFQI